MNSLDSSGWDPLVVTSGHLGTSLVEWLYLHEKLRHVELLCGLKKLYLAKKMKQIKNKKNATPLLLLNRRQPNCIKRRMDYAQLPGREQTTPPLDLAMPSAIYITNMPGERPLQSDRWQNGEFLYSSWLHGFIRLVSWTSVQLQYRFSLQSKRLTLY